MGGALGVGNTGPVAEFNLQLDPEAASVLFSCGVELAMVPLEVTHTALVTQPVLDQIGDHTEFRRLVRELLLFFRDSYKSHFDFDDPPLHDPCAVACAARAPAPQTTALPSPSRTSPVRSLRFPSLIPPRTPLLPLLSPDARSYVFAPHIFEAKRYRVDIEYTSPLSFGQSVVDVWAHSGKEPNATVALKMDVPAFWVSRQSLLPHAAGAVCTMAG